MLRAVLYSLIAATSVLGTQFATWANDPPKNKWEVLAVVMGTILSVATALRAYVDQHLTNQKITDKTEEEEKEKTQNEKTPTVS